MATIAGISASTANLIMPTSFAIRKSSDIFDTSTFKALSAFGLTN
jgi:hypothetical protein